MGQIVFQATLGGQTALVGQNTASSYSLTLPLATDTLVGKATTDTLTNKTLTSPTINGATLTTSAFNGTIGATTPSTAVVTSLTDSGLTSGRVTYATTGGLLTDSANLLFNGTTLTANTLNLTNALGLAYGGTGATTLTGYVYGNGTGAMTASSTIPTSSLSGTINLATQVTGTLPVGNGGTGLTSLTAGYIPYGNGTSAFSSSANMTFDGTTLTAAGLSDAGNLTFTGTGNRITGDFSNATDANRVAIQTSTTNGGTRLNIISNGTGTASSLDVFGSSDPTNAAVMRIRQSAVESQIQASISGTGTYLPLTMYTGGSERLRITTTGGVGIGTTTPTVATNYGSLAINGSSGAFIDALVGGTRIGGFEADASNLYVQSIANVPMILRTNSTERVRIDTSGNVGIGTSSPNASAILDAQSTSKGVRMPNMTTTQKNAISSPAAGLIVFDTTLAKLCVYSGSAWQTITSI